MDQDYHKERKRIEDDKFRVRRPSYQNWNPNVGDSKSWEEMLKFVNALDPARIRGYRIQVNWKREEEMQPKA